MEHRATVRDVAALAGVSIKTVSRVVNDEPNVSAATRSQVRRAIEQLQYLPDASAANLARQERLTRSIALLLATVDDPFCSSVFRGVEEVARERGVVVLAASTEGQPEVEATLIRAFASRSVDGFLIIPTNCDHRPIADLLGKRMPSVYIDRSPLGLTADVITADNHESARTATRHLLRHGHRRIALLADDPTIETARERRAGYESALREAGLPVDPSLIVMGAGTVDAAGVATRRLCSGENPPTAIFASRNYASIGAATALKQLGLSRQVALIGWDEVELAALIDPPLTVIAQDPVGMGRLAATRLFDRITGADITPERLVIPATLIERGSGEIAAAE